MDKEESLKLGIEAGVKEALKIIKEDKNRKNLMKKDRRHHNTHLLLRSYEDLVNHYRESIYSTEQLENPEDVFEELAATDEVEDNEYTELYIESIKKTRLRTKLIIEHIETAFEFYKYRALSSGDTNLIRKYEVIKAIYFDKKKYSDIATELNCSEKTIARDKNIAIDELSILFFGIDGIKF